MTRKSFISGAIILMLAGFVVRVLGFVYRIFLSNLIGAEGIGLFQLIMPVYSLIILTMTAGISIAVSKMVAEELARNHMVNLIRITRCALAIIMISGVAVSVFIYLNIDFIANTILKDSRTYYSLLMIIPCIPVVAAASAIKGYFYGTQDVTPTAISQIVEQIVRIGLVMATASYFLKLGLDYACALATVGMAIGEMANLLVLYIVYRKKREDSRRIRLRDGLIRKRNIIKELINISVPISFNRFISSVMTAVEMIMIPRRLEAGGMDYSGSIAEFGRLSGMAMPLVYFPMLITTSLATTLVPAISEAVSLKRYGTANYRISKSIQITFIVGFVFTAMFLNFPNEIGNILYSRESIGSMLYSLAYTCIFMYLQQTLLGVLNGLGKQGVSLRNGVIGSAVRIGFVYFAVPVYGIRGYVWGMIISMAGVCVLNLYTVIKTTGMVLDFRNWILRPGLVGTAMLLTGRYIYKFFGVFELGNTITIMLTILGYVFVSVLFMIGVGSLEKDELVKMLGLKRTRKYSK